MVPSSGVPTDHSSRWVTSPVVFPEDPSLAWMSPLAESFHPPSRGVSQDCLKLGDSLALEELWIDQNDLRSWSVVSLPGSNLYSGETDCCSLLQRIIPRQCNLGMVEPPPRIQVLGIFEPQLARGRIPPWGDR